MKIVDINGLERECRSVAPDKKFPGFMKVEFTSRVRKGYTHFEWYPVADFVKNNPKLASLAKKAPKPAKEDLGVVSSATSTTLTDKTKGWKENIFASYPLWISRGKGEGQTRKIVSNTHNTIIIDKPWKEVPNGTSQYVISFNIHDPQVLGNVLPGIEEVKPKQKRKKKLVLSTSPRLIRGSV